MPKITLAKGERQRDRVLSDDEASRYLPACPQPWRDVAAIMLGTGMRPGEVYALRWEYVLLNAKGDWFKSRKGSPGLPAVSGGLIARHGAQGCPIEGWVFPTGSRSGHLEESIAKKYHAKALAVSGVKPFEPYCLRHTALAWLSPRCDASTLARIPGHSSITITQRYCHPRADAVEAAFQKMASSAQLITNGGYHEEMLPPPVTMAEAPNESAARG
jgi:integrase